MAGSHRRRHAAGTLAATFWLSLIVSGCHPEKTAETASGTPAQPTSNPSFEPEKPPESAPLPTSNPRLTDAAKALVETLRTASESPRTLAREAEKHVGFVSNPGGATPYDHWYMQRRMGVDPGANLLKLLEEPYAARTVGDEVWYIWPDMAVWDAAAFIPGRLSFADRARLIRLLGQERALAVINGAPWPGHRLAITDTGRWVYFLDSQ